jgi:zinc transport system ATP-binding protein
VKEIVLSLKDVTVYRDTYPAVEDVSFCLEAGTDTSIVDPNGGGKITLVEARGYFRNFT